MNKLLKLLLIAMLFVAGCKAHKPVVSSSKKETTSEYQNSTEKTVVSEKDSAIRVKSPTEGGQSMGLRNSLLRTSLAWSRAWMDSTGRLNHTIANNDSITVPLKIKSRDHTQLIRLKFIKTITIAERTTIKVNELTFLQKFQIYGFRIFALLILILIIYKLWLKKLIPMPLLAKIRK